MFTFDIITLIPKMFEVLTTDGVLSRAINKGEVNVKTWNPRDYVSDIHQTIDDKPFGGGPGMVMMIEPVLKVLEAIKASHQKKNINAVKTIFLSPKGKTLTHKKVVELSKIKNLILISGRYEGIDQRIIDNFVDEEISIGDYVTSGGELPAMILVDAVSRLLPGVLNNVESYEGDSFYNGFLDYNHYTRPANYDDLKVPEVLLSGDHKKIAVWRKKNALLETFKKRPDLINDQELTIEQSRLLQEVLSEQEQDLKKKEKL